MKDKLSLRSNLKSNSEVIRAKALVREGLAMICSQISHHVSSLVNFVIYIEKALFIEKNNKIV